MASIPITSWQIDGGKVETDFHFHFQWKKTHILFSWAPKSLRMVSAATKLKDTCSLEKKL